MTPEQKRMSRPPTSSAALLRDIQHATARMKKARRLLTDLRQSEAKEAAWEKAAEAALDSVRAAAAITASVPSVFADPDSLLKIIQMQRFATGLLVKVRRVKSALAKEGGLRELAGPAVDLDTDSDDWSEDE